MTGLVPNVWAGTVIPIPFAGLVLVLRLKARRMTRMSVGYDDAFSIAAWFFAIAYSIAVLIWVSDFKLGQRISSDDPYQIDYYLEKSYLILWITEFLYSWSICLSKLSVLTFYRRIFRFSSIWWPINILTGLCIIWILIRTFFTIFRCSPVRAYWIKSIQARCMTHVKEYYFATDLTHTLLDTLILALPIFEVVRMKLPPGQKIAVVGLFASGFLVCIASALQIISSQNYNSSSKDFPYQMAHSMVWASVEVHLAVIVSGLPLLRPIFRKVIPNLSSGQTYDGSRPSLALHPSTSFRNPIRAPRNQDPSDTTLASIYSGPEEDVS
ncbi:hypothetical protein BGZ63DRAFT_351646 [Mariannaea sp. PMI_226]|nr:hypothetical protein BGZ63DRAFT_351646 [Mariannaea sp. PMI_226]